MGVCLFVGVCVMGVCLFVCLCVSVMGVCVICVLEC